MVRARRYDIKQSNLLEVFGEYRDRSDLPDHEEAGKERYGDEEEDTGEDGLHGSDDQTTVDDKLTECG